MASRLIDMRRYLGAICLFAIAFVLTTWFSVAGYDKYQSILPIPRLVPVAVLGETAIRVMRELLGRGGHKHVKRLGQI
jgi:hypothetical protein